MKIDTKNVLPTSLPRETRGIKYHLGMNWRPIFCANCGKEGGFVPEEHANFAFWLCDPCGESWGQMAGTYAMPDEVFWQKVADERKE